MNTYEVAIAIQQGHISFESSYTFKVHNTINENTVSTNWCVRTDALMNSLTQEEKLQLSQYNSLIKRYVLSIHNKTWYYIGQVNQWVLVEELLDDKAVYSPEFVLVDEHLVLEVETGDLFTKINEDTSRINSCPDLSHLGLVTLG